MGVYRTRCIVHSVYRHQSIKYLFTTPDIQCLHNTKLRQYNGHVFTSNLIGRTMNEGLQRSVFMGIYVSLYTPSPIVRGRIWTAAKCVCVCVCVCVYIYIKPYKHTRTPQKGRGFVAIMEDRWQIGDQAVLTNWRLLRLAAMGVEGAGRHHAIQEAACGGCEGYETRILVFITHCSLVT